MTKRVSLHDRADADGITDTAAAKTSSVVDTLIAPAVAAGEQTIVEIPVGKVVPHPRNRKILDEDVADLVASFKAGEPILNALGVTAAADWNAGKPDDLKAIQSDEFIITAGGHRRLRAAELAGRKTVPCIVRATFAGAEGRKAALVENLHRQDLDPFDEAEAFAELTGAPYKLSQRDLAAIVGCNQSHISKRLKLRALPSLVRESVRVGKLPIVDAVELGRVADDEDLLASAMQRVTSWGWSGKQAADDAIEKRKTEQLRVAEVEKLTADGVALVDRAPDYYPGASACRLTGLSITPAKHKAEPCHAAYVEARYGKAEVIYVCTKPKRHIGDKAVSKVKSSYKPSQYGGRGPMSDQEKVEKKRRAELKKVVEPSRLSVLHQLVTLNGFDASTRKDLVTRSVIDRLVTGGYSNLDTDVAVDLLGIRPANERAYLADVLRKHADTAKPELLALAGAVTYYETLLRGTAGGWQHDDRARWYLGILERNGYVITDTERELLGDTRNDDGTWSPPAPDEVDPADAQCRVCCVYLDDLPQGVTKVADDLCSACSDAETAGWVAPAPAPLEVPRPYQQVDEQGFIECLECEHGQPTEGCDCTSCFCNPANVDEPAAAEAVLA